MDEYTSANRAKWEDRVPIHLASAFYDIEGWLAQERGPRPWELEALGDVRGLDLVHLQCHFGLDTLQLARAGARVTGVDFSPTAIAHARDLAERSGLADRATFVEADVLRASDELSREAFDIVYVSLGSLCWLPSVERWAAQVEALLRPAGRLYLHDSHPLAWALADDELRIEHTYFEEEEPYVDDSGLTYADGDARLDNTRSYEWNHSLGEIISAVVAHGLVVDGLMEHDWTVWPRFPWLVETDDGRWATPPGEPRAALSFTLVAGKR